MEDLYLVDDPSSFHRDELRSEAYRRLSSPQRSGKVVIDLDL